MFGIRRNAIKGETKPTHEHNDTTAATSSVQRIECTKVGRELRQNFNIECQGANQTGKLRINDFAEPTGERAVCVYV